MAATVLDPAGKAIASITAVGPTDQVQPRQGEIGKEVLAHLQRWRQRSVTAREAI